MGSAAAAATDLPPLPTAKTPGWEFTDLSELNLGDFAEAPEGERLLRTQPTLQAWWSRVTARPSVRSTYVGPEAA